MNLDASILKRLAALRLRPAAMAEVLSIIADIDQSPCASPADTKTRHADSQRRYKERQRVIQKVSPDGSPNAMSPIPPKDITPPSPHSKIGPLSRTRGTALPEDWQPTEDLFTYAISKGLSRQQAVDSFEEFRLWAHANRNRGIACKSDWNKTAMNWLIREAKRTRSRDGPIGRSNGSRRAMEDFLREDDDDTTGCKESAGQDVFKLVTKR